MTSSFARTSRSTGSTFCHVSRKPFQLTIHNGELAQLQSWVLLHENIETGGDLFGLWSTENTAVVHLVLGPGERSRRTTTSFFQDAEYLGAKGRQIVQEYGLCHIGEWHSHHTLGLAKPSAGDESTVWRHMPNNGFKRFIVCIANIDRGESRGSHRYRASIPREACVGLGCFLFEVKDTVTWDQYDMLQGSFKVIDGQSSYRKARALQRTIRIGAESVHSPHEVNVAVSRGYDIRKTGFNIFLYRKSQSTSLNYGQRTVIDRSSRDLTSVSKSGIPPNSDTRSIHRAGTHSKRNRNSHGDGGRSRAPVESVKTTSRERPQTPNRMSSTALKGRDTRSIDRVGTHSKRNRNSHGDDSRSRAPVESVKTTSRERPQTPSRTSSSALQGSGLIHRSNRQAVTSTNQMLEKVGAPLWDILLPTHQSLLENLAHDLTGELIKELDAVTIHFKVGVPSKYDLACRLIFHEDKGHTLKLYTSGLASTPSLTIDLNKHRTSLVATTIVERIQKTVAGVTAKMPARNQVISAAAPRQNPQDHRFQNTSRSSTCHTTTRTGTNSRYGNPNYSIRGRSSPKVDLESKLQCDKYMSRVGPY